MVVWVLQGIHEGEMFAPTHLTEKGAALAAIREVLVWLEVDDEESATDAVNRRGWSGVPGIADGDSEDPPEWDIEKMKVMKRRELWEIFREWSEMTWDNDHGFQLEVNSTVIQA